MSVIPVVKTPPSVAALTSAQTYTPKNSTVVSTIYQAPTNVENANSPGSPSIPAQALAVVAAGKPVPNLYCYVRNNRLVGYFNSVAEAMLALDWHASRENELGADI